MSTNTGGTRSGVILAALAAMLLFALTTVALGIWGGMQYQALQASCAECAALEQRVASMKSDMDQMAARSAPMRPTVPPPPAPMPPLTLTKDENRHRDAIAMVNNTDHTMVTIEPAKGYVLLEDVIESGEMNNRAMDPDMLLVYGEFLDQHGLTPEKRAYVVAFLDSHRAKLKYLGIPLYETSAPRNGESNERSPAEQEALLAGLSDILRDDLSKVLSPGELADWDHYEATLEERMNTKLLDMLLSMIAGSMSNEGRTVARDVLAEETIAAIQRAKDHNGSVGTRIPWAQRVAARSEAVRIARERLATALTPNDMQAYDRFAESMRAQQEIMDGQPPVPPHP